MDYHDDGVSYQVFDLGNEAEYEEWLILRHLDQAWRGADTPRLSPGVVAGLQARGANVWWYSDLGGVLRNFTREWDKWYDVADAWWSNGLTCQAVWFELERKLQQADMKGKVKHGRS